MPETIAAKEEGLIQNLVVLEESQQYRTWVSIYTDQAWVIAHGEYENVEYKKCHFGTSVVWVRADQTGWQN